MALETKNMSMLTGRLIRRELMGVSYKYDATIDQLLEDLESFKKQLGGGARVTLSSPGMYDPNFEGRNSRLMVVSRGSELIISEEDRK